jgi:hypothetical protein
VFWRAAARMSKLELEQRTNIKFLVKLGKSRNGTQKPRPRAVTSLTNSLIAKPLHCNTPHLNTRAHYFAYLSRYGRIKEEVTNCTPDDGHVLCPKHVDAIKLHILLHLVGSLPFTMSTMHGHMNIAFQTECFEIHFQ